jgi:hypothetical protein
VEAGDLVTVRVAVARLTGERREQAAGDDRVGVKGSNYEVVMSFAFVALAFCLQALNMTRR